MVTTSEVGSEAGPDGRSSSPSSRSVHSSRRFHSESRSRSGSRSRSSKSRSRSQSRSRSPSGSRATSRSSSRSRPRSVSDASRSRSASSSSGRSRRSYQEQRSRSSSSPSRSPPLSGRVGEEGGTISDQDQGQDPDQARAKEAAGRPRPRRRRRPKVQSCLPEPLPPPPKRPPVPRLACVNRAAAKPVRAPRPVRERVPTVLEVLDEELARLRPRVQQQTVKRADMREELEAAKALEHKERENLMMSRDTRRKRAHVLTLRMQAAIRGWMVRRRFVRALNKEYAAQAGYMALLPNQLRDQLRDLKHAVHDLRYQGEHREQAILSLQAAWRGVLARRAVRILRIADSMRKVLRRMTLAATKIAAWFRAIHMRLKYRDEISERMRATAARQMEEMMEGLKVVIKLQRAFRARLAVRTVHRRRTEVAGFAADALAECGQAQQQHRQSPDDADRSAIDTWRPGGLTAEGAPEVLAASDQELPSCRADRELEKIQEAGLTPFYWSAANDPTRHRVGGKYALKMIDVLGLELEDDDWERQFASATAASQRTFPTALDADLDPREEEPLDIRKVGDRWNLYPLGLSENFIEDLDEDTWPWTRKKRSKPKVAKAPRRKVPPPQPPPKNSSYRAAIREAQQQTLELAAKAALEEGLAEDEQEELHPLFDNAPPLPKAKKQPARTLPPVPGSQPRRKARPPDDECSWSNARSFSHCPKESTTEAKNPKNMGKLIDAQYLWGSAALAW